MSITNQARFTLEAAVRGLYLGARFETLRMMFKDLSLFSLAVAGVFCQTVVLAEPSVAPTPAVTNVVFKEIQIAHLATNDFMTEIKVSPDNRHVAYILKHGRRWSVWRDGIEGEPADRVSDLVFSPDSQRLAYVAHYRSNDCVVVDGKQQAYYPIIGPACVVFSPDSRRLAYVGWRDHKWLAVVDGKEGKGYDRISKVNLAFSADGSRFAYAAMREKEAFWIVDGKESAPLGGMGLFSMTADGKRYACIAPGSDDWVVMIDGEAKHYDQVSQTAVIFSPDGQHSLYAAGASKLQVFLDGRGQQSFDMLIPGFMSFSPDSKRTAYAGTQGDGWCVILDGKEGTAYNGLMGNSLVYSPDSRQVAYAARRGKDWLVVHDGEEGKPYEGIVAHSLTFSPDSRHLAYVAGRAGKFVAVRDGQETPAYAGFGAHGVVFSPDSRRCVYVVQEGTQWLTVMEGKPGKPYDGISLHPFDFSADGRHFGFVGSRGGKFLLVLDGAESPAYDQILANADAGSSFGAFHLLALKHDAKEMKIVRVEAQPATL